MASCNITRYEAMQLLEVSKQRLEAYKNAMARECSKDHPDELQIMLLRDDLTLWQNIVNKLDRYEKQLYIEMGGLP